VGGLLAGGMTPQRIWLHPHHVIMNDQATLTLHVLLW
jgi:hypothetical protein